MTSVDENIRFQLVPKYLILSYFLDLDMSGE